MSKKWKVVKKRKSSCKKKDNFILLNNLKPDDDTPEKYKIIESFNDPVDVPDQTDSKNLVI